MADEPENMTLILLREIRGEQERLAAQLARVLGELAEMREQTPAGALSVAPQRSSRKVVSAGRLPAPEIRKRQPRVILACQATDFAQT